MRVKASSEVQLTSDAQRPNGDPLLEGSLDLSQTERMYDAIVGVRGSYRFGDTGRWRVPYYADVGAGDSDLTWQAMTGLA